VDSAPPESLTIILDTGSERAQGFLCAWVTLLRAQLPVTWSAPASVALSSGPRSDEELTHHLPRMSRLGLASLSNWPLSRLSSLALVS
jgi:hypothetical protein